MCWLRCSFDRTSNCPEFGLSERSLRLPIRLHSCFCENSKSSFFLFCRLRKTRKTRGVLFPSFPLGKLPFWPNSWRFLLICDLHVQISFIKPSALVWHQLWRCWIWNIIAQILVSRCFLWDANPWVMLLSLYQCDPLWTPDELTACPCCSISSCRSMQMPPPRRNFSGFAAKWEENGKGLRFLKSLRIAAEMTKLYDRNLLIILANSACL